MNTSRLQVNPRYFWALASLVAASLITYVFLVQGSIYYSVSANALSSLIQTKESELAVLESNFFIVSESVDINLARKLGFVDSENPVFIALNASGELVGYAGGSH